VDLGRTVRTYLLPRRHTALLATLVMAFAARPVIGDARLGLVAFNIALLLVLLLAIYSVQVDELVGEREALVRRKRRSTRSAWILAAPAVVERVAATFWPSHRRWVIGVFVWLVFLAFVTWTQLRSLIKQKEVTAETISMTVSVYLLLAVTWGMLFIAIHQVQPQAFSFGSSPTGDAAPPSEVFPVLLYFSLTTLATVGYGDVLPVSLQARYAAVAEGITGQFYLAILVARLVAIQVSTLQASDERTHSRDTRTDPSAAAQLPRQDGGFTQRDPT
jgi:voltage-gated potassium channel